MSRRRGYIPPPVPVDPLSRPVVVQGRTFARGYASEEIRDRVEAQIAKVLSMYARDVKRTATRCPHGLKLKAGNVEGYAIGYSSGRTYPFWSGWCSGCLHDRYHEGAVPQAVPVSRADVLHRGPFASTDPHLWVEAERRQAVPA